jgi:hypothetical protein
MNRKRGMSGRDPYWATAKYAGVDAYGHPIKKGDRIFYYPNTRTTLVGESAEKASAEFETARFDEAQETGTW